MSTVYKNLLIALPPKKNPKNNPTSLHKKKNFDTKKNLEKLDVVEGFMELYNQN